MQELCNKFAVWSNSFFWILKGSDDDDVLWLKLNDFWTVSIV
jgi:hypothetical protein